MSIFFLPEVGLDEMDEAVVSKLLSHREKLLGYVRKKLSNPELAEDVLQESLLKAVRAAPDLREEEKLLPWFYRILNNAIVDAYRKKHREAEVMAPSEGEELAITREEEATLCACFRELIPTLKPEYGELIESLELADGDPEKVADRLGITRNNLKVRRHRARQALRARLEETCRACAKHGCLDCTCRKG
jgi:RNA polymerase sigma factor (sigma-70 family)